MFPTGWIGGLMGRGAHGPAPSAGERIRLMMLAIVALLSVSGLAYGLIRATAPQEPEAHSPSAATAASAAPARTARGSDAHRATSAGRPDSTSAPQADASPSAATAARRGGGAGAAPRPQPLSERRAAPILEQLERRRAADRAAGFAQHRSGRVTSGSGGRRGTRGLAPAGPAPTDPASPGTRPDGASDGASDGADADPDAKPLSSYTPGYAEVAGVEVRTPASSAGIRRGDRILEYNGTPVDGRTSLETAWSAPGQPEFVSVLVEDGRSGQVYEVYVPPGDFGIVQPPANRN